MAWNKATDEANTLIAAAVNFAGEGHIFRPSKPAIALTMSMTPAYDFILGVHSALFETHAAAELMRNFLGRARKHVGLPKSPSLKQEFKDAIAQGGGDPTWCDGLEDVRGFFSHEGTAFIAIDVSHAARDLLLMKKNLHEFDDENAYLRYSELRSLAEGFRRSKAITQSYIATLYAQA